MGPRQRKSFAAVALTVELTSATSRVSNCDEHNRLIDDGVRFRLDHLRFTRPAARLGDQAHSIDAAVPITRLRDVD